MRHAKADSPIGFQSLLWCSVIANSSSDLSDFNRWLQRIGFRRL